MKFNVLTLFPQMIADAVSHSIIGRAVQSGAITVECVNIRDFAVNKHGQVDDAPYGGGAGMVMMASPVCDAFASLHTQARVVYLTPQGKPFNQQTARELSQEKELVLLCGHYEGLDERAIEEIVTDEISIGDYVLTGGEVAALVLIDAIARLLPGVLGKQASFLDESFSGDNLLEYPHYTRPPVFRGREVPAVLLSGHHKQIEDWRKQQSLARTKIKRPDLLTLCMAFVLLLFLCACSTTNNEAPEIYAINMDELAASTDTTAVSEMRPAAKRDTDFLRVYILQSADEAGQRQAVERATERVQATGFHLIFDLSDMKDYTAGEESDFENALYESEPGVHIVYKWLAYSHLDRLGDFYTQAQAWSPLYLKNAESINGVGSLQLMPTGFGRFSKQPAVFVRDDVYSAYGKVIRSAGDLEALLEWLAKSGHAPGLVWHSVYPYTGMELFLPEMGYTSLQSLLAEWLDIDTLFWRDEETGDIAPFYDMPAAREAIWRYSRWLESGLAETAAQRSDPADYPVILANARDLRPSRSSHTEGLLKAMQGYTLNVFSAPDHYYSDSHHLAVAPKNADISEFLRFMEWLDDIGNYRYFMYGLDGTEDDDNGCVAYFRRRAYEDVLRECPYNITGYPHELLFTLASPPAQAMVSKDTISALMTSKSDVFDYLSGDMQAYVSGQYELRYYLSGYIHAYESARFVLQRMFFELRDTHSEAQAMQIIEQAFDEIRQLDYINEIERLFINGS